MTNNQIQTISAIDRQLDEIDLRLVEAQTMGDVTIIQKQLKALGEIAKAANVAVSEYNRIKRRELLTQRAIGEMLRELERGHGNRYTKLESDSLSDSSPSEYTQTITDNGIHERQARRWQELALIPQDVFVDALDEIETESTAITNSVFGRLAHQYKREALVAERKNAPQLPDDKYRIVYADPPWRYGDSGVITENDNYGRVNRHYSDMSIKELCELPVKAIVENDAVLFLWVTSPLLVECIPIIEAWGFKYKTSFVWDKVGHNFGHYNSVRHEFLLVCTRGSCLPDNSKLYDSVISIQKSRTHSEKPKEFREIIDDLYTYGKRIELFARKAAEGWDIWGNEI